MFGSVTTLASQIVFLTHKIHSETDFIAYLQYTENSLLNFN